MVVEKLREGLNLPIDGVKKNMGRTDLFKHQCRSAFVSFFYWWAGLAVSLDGISSTRTILGANRVASGHFKYLSNHQELSHVQMMKKFPLIESYNSCSKRKTSKLDFGKI